MPINEAIERAHRHGILTAASLMVAPQAATDAIARARANPSLKVGLHVTVVRGEPLLPREQIRDLVDADGQLPRDLFRAGVRFFFRPAARAQLEAEIRAQFERYRESGLPLDHVDAHNHMHVHPTVFSTILRVGREYGMKAIRIPYEPLSPDRFFSRLLWAIFLWPWMWLMRLRARRAGLAANDAIFGIADTGHLTADRMMEIIDRLPDGLSEIYLHPAAADRVDDDPLAALYERQAELEALTSPQIAAKLRDRGIVCTTFGDE